MKTIAGAVAAVLVMSLVASPVQAEFNKRWYLGLGGGASFMSPDPNDSGYENDEEGDTAAKIFLGRDFTRRWALELHFAELGEATLKQREGQTLTPPSGAVDYQAAGLSVLYHLYNSQGTSGYLDRTGLALFARLGVGILDTSSDDLEVEQLEDAHVLLGLGLEYGFESGLAIRAEYEAFDQDAQLATLGVLWRFGGGLRVPAIAPPSVTDTGTDTVTDTSSSTDPTSTAPTSPAGNTLDTDLDGVTAGSVIRDGVLAGVGFDSGSATLTAEARQVLDQTATDLLRSPGQRVAIMAHTDNQGRAAGNLELSKKRALAVARYLVSRGVAGSRLRPEAYGESKPAVSNATQEGRALNRRIELRSLN